MKKLPIGLQDFGEIINGDYLYIDKTRNIYDLLLAGKYFFLSRPRRFGKSLTLNTIREIYQGNKDLFKGLWIYDQWDWHKIHPVIHISFNEIGYKELGLKEAIDAELDKIAQQYGIVYEQEGLGRKFKELINKTVEKYDAKVILLIDEYDKPIIDYLQKEKRPIADKHRQILRSFYGIIKSSDANLEFMLITGVSKFSKVSIFSDLNHLRDITIADQFATLVGCTQKELEFYFEPYIKHICEKKNIEKGQLLKDIKYWYNGYSWDGESFVYNPFSILNYMQDARFNNYWFATGTPTFLIDLFRERFDFSFEKTRVGGVAFESYDVENMTTIPLLFQTGYLTIKEIDEFDIYTLDYPNREVKDAMMQHMIGAFSFTSPVHTKPKVVDIYQALLRKDIETVISIVNSLFSSIPYDIFIAKSEAYYHSLLHLMFNYLGLYAKSEVNVSKGRADMIIEVSSVVYVFEFKLDQSPEVAIEQIKSKKYYAPYLNNEKQLIAVGVNLSTKEKGIDGYLIEEVK